MTLQFSIYICSVLICLIKICVSLKIFLEVKEVYLNDVIVFILMTTLAFIPYFNTFAALVIFIVEFIFTLMIPFWTWVNSKPLYRFNKRGE